MCVCVCVGKRGQPLVAMLRDVDHNGFFPAEEEVARASAGGHGDAEISVVGHEDEHQEVADHHLDDVKDGLEEVRDAQHLLANRTGEGE